MVATDCNGVTNLNEQSIYDKVIDGGIGYGSICLPSNIFRYIIMIIFPPLAVFLDEWDKGFKRIDKIIVNFILTAFFYFPGLIHALAIVDCNDNSNGLSKCNS